MFWYGLLLRQEVLIGLVALDQANFSELAQDFWQTSVCGTA